jgi:hypothetical protein
VHFLREQLEQCETQPLTECKKVIEAKGEFQKVPLDPRVPDKTICIGTEASQQDQAKLLSFLDKNNDVFAWLTSDLVGVNKDVIEHRLQVSPNARPKRTEASQNGGRKSASSKGQGVKITRRRFHQRSDLS